MQLHTEKDQKEIKKHGNYEFPVHISLILLSNILIVSYA